MRRYRQIPSRLPRSMTRLLAALCLASTSGVRAQDPVDVTEPAGELPPEGEMEQEPDLPAAEVPKAPTETDAAAGGANDDTKKASEKDSDEAAAQDSWDSYSDPGGSSVAQEITGGVRVEDIVEPPTDYRYAAFGKPDPFVPPMVTEEKDEATMATASSLEIPIVSPLQRFKLDQLSLVGIWQLNTGERKAMVLADGQGIIVKNGDPIGNRGGRILGIGDTYLTVREFSLAPDGTRQFEDQQLYMGDRPDVDVAGKIRFIPGQRDPEILIESAAKPAEASGTPGGPDSARPQGLGGPGGAPPAAIGTGAVPPGNGAFDVAAPGSPPSAFGPVPSNAPGQPNPALPPGLDAGVAMPGGLAPPNGGGAPTLPAAPAGGLP